MTKVGCDKGKYAKWTVSVLAAGAFACSPILFPVFAAKFNGYQAAQSNNVFDTYTAAGVDRKLAVKFKRLSTNLIGVISPNIAFTFTPAGINRSANRTMTIAARTGSPLSANAISIRDVVRIVDTGTAKTVILSQSDFKLKAARGWQGFKLPEASRSAIKPPILVTTLGSSSFRLEDSAPVKKSRFKTDVKLAQTRESAPSPRGNAAAGDYKVGLESSFRLTKGVALTAGVQYNSERDRVAPSVDERKDSEAVYVGTKIRF
jgi:hypothetical protein